MIFNDASGLSFQLDAFVYDGLVRIEVNNGCEGGVINLTWRDAMSLARDLDFLASEAMFPCE